MIEKCSFIYKEHIYNKQDNTRQSFNCAHVYSNLEKWMWSGLAWDCWQELSSDVATTGTVMTAEEKHLEHQLLSSELHLEDETRQAQTSW